MSTGPAPSSPAPSSPAASSAKVARPRSRGERLLVRGGILVLLLLAAMQAHARFGYGRTLQQLQSRVAEEDNTGKPLLVSELPGMIVGWPSKKEESDRHWKKVVYSWRGLTQSYEIRMVYDTSDKDPAIMSLETADAPEEQIVAVEPVNLTGGAGADDPMPDPSAGHSGPGGGGAGGAGGGGGERPDIMASDADGDGKVSRAEAPERMAQFFDRMDTNSDGFIDADEVDAARARRAAREADGADGAEGRPRPAETDAAPTTDSTEKPAAPAEATSPANEKP